MLMSFSHKFIFFHVPKTGGGSVRLALRPYCRPYYYTSRIFYHLGMRRDRAPVYFHWHIKATQARDILPGRMFDTYYKFAFVRNPWDWHVSYYHYMLREPTEPQHEFFKSMSGFEEYLYWRVENNIFLQKSRLTDENDNLIVDFVGKLENLAEDYATVCRTLKLKNRLIHTNRSNHQDYCTYYTPELRDLVAQHFAADIELFDYDFG